MDGLSKVLHRTNKAKIGQLPLLHVDQMKTASEVRKALSNSRVDIHEFVDLYNQALQTAHPRHSNPIFNVMYNKGSLNGLRERVFEKLTLAGRDFDNKAIGKAFKSLSFEPMVDDFFRALNRNAVVTTVVAVGVIGIAVSGFLVQFINDKVYSTLVKPVAEFLVNRNPLPDLPGFRQSRPEPLPLQPLTVSRAKVSRPAQSVAQANSPFVTPSTLAPMGRLADPRPGVELNLLRSAAMGGAQ